MIITETYTQNSINPTAHDEAFLHSSREPTAEEISYINQHCFDNAAAYADSKGWKLVRIDRCAATSGNEESKSRVGRICSVCGTLNDECIQICKNCSVPMDGAKYVQVDEALHIEKVLSEEDVLQHRMQKIEKPSIVGVFSPLLLIPFGLTGMVCCITEGGFFRVIFGLIVGAFFSLLGASVFAANRDSYRLAQTDLDAYRRKVIAEKDAIKKARDPATILEREYQQAVASQTASEPWAVRYSIHPCPYCGHYKVRFAKWEDKQLSVAFWGAASSAIGKEYKCEHCGKMW